MQGVTVTHTATRARYQQIGKRVWGTATLAISSSGTAAATISIALPVTAAEANAGGGSWWYLDADGTYHSGGIHIVTTSLMYFVGEGLGSYFGATVTAASSDVISVTFEYEAA